MGVGGLLSFKLIDSEMFAATTFSAGLMLVSFISMIVGVIGTIVISFGKKEEEYRTLYKTLLVKAVISEFFEKPIYEPEYGFSGQEIEEMYLLERVGVCFSEDYIHATYQNVTFVQADVRVEEFGTNRNSYIFQGRVFDFDFPKEVKTDVLVYGKAFSGISSYAKAKPEITMESADFIKRFRVFCNEAETAFYVLTPQIINAILYLGSIYQNRLAFRFTQGRVYVAIATKQDAFEPEVDKRTDYFSQCQRIRNELQVIVQFITELGLNHETFKDSRYSVRRQLPLKSPMDDVLINMYREKMLNDNINFIGAILITCAVAILLLSIIMPYIQ